jgi:chemotaxis protein methyltransferase CheR
MTPMGQLESSIPLSGKRQMETDHRAASGPDRILSDRVFKRFSEFITAELGIKMPPSKKTMLQGRLQKRLRILGMKSFKDYADYVFGPEGRVHELVNMLDLVTTNKTDFFREPRHFAYLTGTILPELMRKSGAGVRRTLSIWSAGCATGAEPYTLAMVLSEFANSVNGFDFSILGTDISTQVLDRAKRAVYREGETAPVPLEIKKRYLLRSRDRSNRLVRIVPALRSKVRLKRLNFMDAGFDISQSMDVIFFRNVIIYFERPTQEAVIQRMCRHLKPGGYLFTGHSETLHGLDLPLISTANSVYRKEAG